LEFFRNFLFGDVCDEYLRSNHPYESLGGIPRSIKNLTIMKKFKVISSKTADSGNVVTKLRGSIIINNGMFGSFKRQQTLYVRGDKEFKVDSELKIDFNLYEIKPSATPYVDEFGETIMIDWLIAK